MTMNLDGNESMAEIEQNITAKRYNKKEIDKNSCYDMKVGVNGFISLIQYNRNESIFDF